MSSAGRDAACSQCSAVLNTTRGWSRGGDIKRGRQRQRDGEKERGRDRGERDKETKRRREAETEARERERRREGETDRQTQTDRTETEHAGNVTSYAGTAVAESLENVVGCITGGNKERDKRLPE